MEKIILDMIEQANQNKDYQLIWYVKQLINIFAQTINCPFNWRSIGSELVHKYNKTSWVYKELELFDYELPF